MITSIQKIPNWTELTPEQLLDALNEPSIEIRDDRMYTWAGVSLLCGSDAAEQMYDALIGSGRKWAAAQLAGTGLQVTHPDVRDAIELMVAAGIELQPLLEATIQNISIAQQDLGTAATLDDVEQALDQHYFDQQLTNAIALFTENMTMDSDAASVMAQAWNEAAN